MEEIKGDASVVQILVDTTPIEAYRAVANVLKWKEWRKKDPKVKVNGEDKEFVSVGDTFVWNAGVSITSTITEAVEGENLTWKGTTLGGMLKAHHRWEFKEEDGKTRVIITEAMSGLLKFLMTKSAITAANKEWADELEGLFKA